MDSIGSSTHPPGLWLCILGWLHSWSLWRWRRKTPRYCWRSHGQCCSRVCSIDSVTLAGNRCRLSGGDHRVGGQCQKNERYGEHIQFLKDILVSRKSQGLILLVLVVLLGEAALGLDSSQITLTAEGIMAYILGRGLADIKK